MRPEDLFSCVGDLDRSFCLACCDCGNDLQRDDLAFAAKAAAYQRFDDPYLRHWQFQQDGELVLVIVRHLGRGPYGEASWYPGLGIDIKRCQGAMGHHGGMCDFSSLVTMLSN